jgi:hypothetical protein
MAFRYGRGNCPRRLTDRPLASEAGNTGSIPVGDTIRFVRLGGLAHGPLFARAISLNANGMTLCLSKGSPTVVILHTPVIQPACQILLA